MPEERAWIVARVRLGWLLFTVGAAVVVIATVLSGADLVPGSDFRVVGGIGILVLGLGVGLVMRYRAALSDDLTARRVVIDERDERNVQIRTRAGNRAWIVSALFVWIGLMWVSLAGDGSVPTLGGDLLWWFLAAAFVVPFLVYAASFTADERRS